MPPPPLTDEEVHQRLLLTWKGDVHARLGIWSDIKGMPDKSASKETWLEVTPAIYRREWEKAYRYSLAEDALEVAKD
ncbi:hypothetical protein [Armatimonas sp.]|uniref:hypothetical protein n=1 Tax=Armatimonas sp. TaxID=1872638 RepID=UPI00286B76A8|nr:hypothetical protein [Armatimonas sp.]